MLKLHGVSAKQLVRAGQDYLSKKLTPTTEYEHRPTPAEKAAVLNLLSKRVEGTPTASELTEPLTYNASFNGNNNAVLVCTSAIDINGVQLTKYASELLCDSAGLTLDALSHWALCVVDRGDKQCYVYDLMSDQMLPSFKVGRSYPRCFPVTSELIEGWTSVTYIGETLKEHGEIVMIASNFISLHPKYNLFDNNCQHLAEELVRELCDGKTITRDNLGEEVRKASTRMSSAALMKMHFNEEDLKKLGSNIKSAGDKFIKERGTKIAP